MSEEEIPEYPESGDWDAVFESVGVWPLALELEIGVISYAVWYRLPDGQDRLLTEDGRVRFFSSTSEILNFGGSSPAGVSKYAREKLNGLVIACNKQIPPDAAIARILVAQVAEWFKEAGITTTEQAGEALNVLNLLDDWHATLESCCRKVGSWPEVLDEAANLLAGLTMFGDLELHDVRDGLEVLGVTRALTQELDALTAKED